MSEATEHAGCDLTADANSRPVEPGDVVTVECDGLGVLENRVAEGAHDISDEAGWMPCSTPETRRSV
jgi:5-oxopent-3-ene-1,2,5-tricarboxylate decarboxylase/2-hydroxyhepta-2,4-diene-1,7-dioate isomerase